MTQGPVNHLRMWPGAGGPAAANAVECCPGYMPGAVWAPSPAPGLWPVPSQVLTHAVPRGIPMGADADYPSLGKPAHPGAGRLISTLWLGDPSWLRFKL